MAEVGTNPALIFGTLVRAGRKRADLSQTQLAERISSTQAYVSRTERGLENPPLLTCVAFATAVGCVPDFFTMFHALFTTGPGPARGSIRASTRKGVEDGRRIPRSSQRSS